MAIEQMVGYGGMILKEKECRVSSVCKVECDIFVNQKCTFEKGIDVCEFRLQTHTSIDTWFIWHVSKKHTRCGVVC